MHSQFADFIKDTPEGKIARDIITRCVHCGFCNATCPTYQLSGDELDGPRGRIYLLKNFFEGEPIRQKTIDYLDRCLTCGACETTCPSGVQYTRLADVGRHSLESYRPWRQRLVRRLLLSLLPFPNRLRPLIRLARLFKPVLPPALRRKLSLQNKVARWPDHKHKRHMLLLPGCVQSVLASHINVYAAQVLDKLGISALPAPIGCCGALGHHLGSNDSLDPIRQNIDRWWPYLDQGAEAVIMTSSGCAQMVKQYGELLANDADYAAKARKISASLQDMGELLAEENLSAFSVTPKRIAFQAPCTLQHGLGLDKPVETVLTRLGFVLAPVSDNHLCCGSAGAYSLLQPKISKQLRQQKLATLQAGNPELIATANIGCLLHLEEKAKIPIVHWLELLG